MLKKNLKNKVAPLLLCLAVLFPVSCADQESRCIMPTGFQLQAGDVVFRHGSGTMSRMVLVADRGGIYSHVGIVVDSAGVMMIAHAVPDEPDFEGDVDRVKLDRPEEFFSAVKANHGEVMRCIDKAGAARAAGKAMEIYRQGMLFDHDYDDADSTRMYCCELVIAAYRRAGLQIAEGAQHSYKVPGLNSIRCYFPSNLYNSKLLISKLTF